MKKIKAIELESGRFGFKCETCNKIVGEMNMVWYDDTDDGHVVDASLVECPNEKSHDA